MCTKFGLNSISVSQEKNFSLIGPAIYPRRYLQLGVFTHVLCSESLTIAVYGWLAGKSWTLNRNSAAGVS